MPQLESRLLRVLACALFGATVAACGTTDSAPPVAAVSFTSNRARVPAGSPVELTYKFDVSPGAKIAGDYRVFVHMTDADGTTLWNDDHDPPTPTSKWAAGQTVQYTRTKFVPKVLYQGEVSVEVGLYRDADRLPLQGPDPADRESDTRSYKVGTLQILPEQDNIFLIYKNGWHPSEASPENTTIDWQWIQKVAAISFRNPRKDVNFYIEYDARPDIFSDRPQQVTVYSGEQAVATFAADSSEPVLKIIPVTQAQLGGNEMAELRIEVDRTFVPAKMPSGGRDTRELGIRVYHAFVEGR